MMKALLLADLHGNYDHIDQLLATEPDCLFIAGDITHLGPVTDISTLTKRLSLPVLAVPGNCDPRESLACLDDSDAVCLHGSSITIGSVTIAGIGGSNPTPFDTPFECSEEEIGSTLESLLKRMQKNRINILISHAPPFGILDEVSPDVHVGSVSIKKHLNAFDVVCCAHIHEQRGVVKEGNTWVVNPGPASEGYGAIIMIPDEDGEITIDLISTPQEAVQDN
ncbi:metallophosphoesterase [Methanocalculus taiwanensis]|uniref:Metallophosphoesterase n=1 Tax=Methanocalculus taiwanensis TaxID=106207 RepID=A0ABD4TKV1_9EURY|nr:metallophosphoesterase [Methanocalculus taiwanensis]MCQ1537945.1 metallophosphoesterase [Methanocalculus taiwanensis]